MGHEARINAVQFAVTRAKQSIVKRMAAADCHILDALGVTVIVTSWEDGAAQPTYSTMSMTSWGYALNGLESQELRDEIALAHCKNARLALEKNLAQLEARVAENAKKAAAAAEGGTDGGRPDPQAPGES